MSYKVKGGGHTIPGGKADHKKQKMLGNTNMDIIAEQEILYFLKITKTEF